MRNLKFHIDENETLHIAIDLSKKPRVSRRGNSDVIATSGGNQHLISRDGTYRPEILNLSLYKPRDDD